MKRIVFFLLLPPFLLFSCSTLLTYSLFRWSSKDYKNRDGVSTGIPCVYYAEKKTGRFSNALNFNDFAVVENIVFSTAFGLRFDVYPLPWFFSVSSVPVVIRFPDGSAVSFEGSYSGLDYCGEVTVPYSASLVEALSRDGSYVVFSVSENYVCGFRFPPGFGVVWNLSLASDKKY